MAACVRLQLQNTEDESRGMVQTAQQKAIRDLQGAVVQAWSKLVNFQAKFPFCKQPGRTNGNAEGQLIVFSRSGLGE